MSDEKNVKNESAETIEIRRNLELLDQEILDFEKQGKSLQIKWYFVLAFFIVPFIAISVYLFLLYSDPIREIGYIFGQSALGGIVGSGLYIWVVGLSGWSLTNQLRKQRKRRISLETDFLRSIISENFFDRLISLNFKYLDQYYAQTKDQADKSFILSIVACVSGLVIYSIGIVLLFLDKLGASVLASVIGSFLELLSGTFFYLFNRTTRTMNTYHDKLVLVQNVSLALKTADTMTEIASIDQKAKIISELIRDFNTFLTKER